MLVEGLGAKGCGADELNPKIQLMVTSHFSTIVGSVLRNILWVLTSIATWRH